MKTNNKKFKDITHYADLKSFNEIIDITVYYDTILEFSFADNTKKRYDLSDYDSSDGFFNELEIRMKEVKQYIREKKINRIIEDDI